MSSSSRAARLAALAVFAALTLFAGRPGPAAAEEPVTEPLESETMTWNVTAEAGYRWVNLDGSEPLFRSHNNFDQGTRLFNFSLIGRPLDATSGFIDMLELSAGGLGGDPQEWVRFNMRKRGVYRFDVRFDQSDYFFDVPDFTRFGQHTNRNDRRNFDSLLEFTPGRTRVYVGYARREFSGPAFSTQDYGRDEFFVLAPLDRDTEDIRAGIDFPVGKWKLGFEQSYRKLETFSEFELEPNSGAGNNPTGGSTLTSFMREVPLDGTYWISRAWANRSFGDRVDLSLRLVHSEGETDGDSAQSAAGTWFTAGNPAFTENINASFNSDLPSSLAEVGLSVRLAESVWLHNNLRYHHYEIEGETDQDLDNVLGGVPSSASEEFMRLTDWTAWEGRTEVEWRINRSWGVRGGYRRLDRDVKTEARTDGALTSREEADQAADTFFGGVSYRHNRKFSAHAEFWDGEYDNVFVRVQPADFMLGRFRATFRPGERWAINLSASYRQAENPTPDFANKVNSRTYSASLDYNGTKLTTSTGYSAVNLDSSTDIAFCTGGTCTGTTLVTDVSLWEFADNHVYTNTSYAFSDRIRGSVRARLTDSRDTFPVEYTYVEPRIAVRLFSGYWVNVGWYKYEFDRDDDDTQDYRAYGALLTFSGEF